LHALQDSSEASILQRLNAAMPLGGHVLVLLG
jgi:hypothetical protein